MFKYTTMGNNQKDVDKALKVQEGLEKKLLGHKDVQGFAISTLLKDHSKVCVKIISEKESLTHKDLKIEKEYNGIPVIISYEVIKPQ